MTLKLKVTLKNKINTKLSLTLRGYPEDGASSVGQKEKTRQ